jgi:hypothetical protein
MPLYAVYSVSTGRLRMKLADASPAAVTPFDGKTLGFVELDQPTWDSGDVAIQALITKQTGLVPQNDRYAIVDGLGNVVASVHADPAVDVAPAGYQLVRSDAAQIGWAYSAGAFVAPVVEISAADLLLAQQKLAAEELQVL